MVHAIYCGTFVANESFDEGSADPQLLELDLFHNDTIALLRRQP